MTETATATEKATSFVWEMGTDLTESESDWTGVDSVEEPSEEESEGETKSVVTDCVQLQQLCSVAAAAAVLYFFLLNLS